ncbi:MAG: M28 family metallopeptidase [Promethearchaeota archaeon]
MKEVTEKQLEEKTRYVCDEIKHVIETFGPRTPGAKGEFEALKYMEENLKEHVDATEVEDFRVAPKAFMGFQTVVAIIALVSIVSYWFIPLLALLLSTCSLVIFYLQFIIYKEILDPFFPKLISHNLIATKKPRGEVKRMLIINGHVDASYEFRMSYANPYFHRAFIMGGLSCLLFVILASLLNTVFNGALRWNLGYDSLWGKIGIVILCCSPVVFPIMFWYRYSVVSPGANDNLTACFVTLAIAKLFSEEGVELEHTELKYVITGSEEAGLRGSRDYGRRHGHEANDLETACIVIETLHDMDDFMIFNSDLNGTVKLDARVATLLQKASEQAGFPVKIDNFPFGGGASDAASFQKSGIPSGFIAAMNHLPPRYYHTRLDNWDNLRPDVIKLGLKIVLKAVEIFDKEGLGE